MMNTENQKIPLGQTHFRYLEKDEIENPLYYLDAFCESETDLYYIKESVLDFLKSGFSPNTVFYSRGNPYFAYTHEELIRIMELLYVVYAGGIDVRLPAGHPYAPDNREPLIDRLKGECALTRADFLYRTLAADEMNDIQLFLERFFTFKTLDEWRRLLDELLGYAYLTDNLEVVEYPYSIFVAIELVEKLVEAFFLINHIQSWKRQQPIARADEMAGCDGRPTLPAGDADHGGTPIDAKLSAKLERAVIGYFKMVDPGFASTCLRKILLDALALNLREDTLTSVTPGDSFLFPFQELFVLFDIARRETAHWHQDRVGSDVVFDVW